MNPITQSGSIWSFPLADSPGNALTACTSEELANLRTLTDGKCTESRSDISPTVEGIKSPKIRAAFSESTEAGGCGYDHMVELWNTFNKNGSLPKNEFNAMIQSARSFSSKIAILERSGDTESNANYSYYGEINNLKRELGKIENIGRECFAFACLTAEDSSDQSLTVHVRRKTKATECVREFTNQLPKTMEVVGNILTNRNGGINHEDINSAIEELKKASDFYPKNSWQKQCCETFMPLLDGRKNVDGERKLLDFAEGIQDESLEKGKMFFRQMGMLQHAEDSNPKSDFFWAESAGQAVAVAGIVIGIAIVAMVAIFFPPALLIPAIMAGLAIGIGSCIGGGGIYDWMKNREQAKIDANYFNQKMEEFSEQLSKKPASEDGAAEAAAVTSSDSTDR
jgi:hypothetical protein